MTITEIKQAGHDHGFSDACDWILDESRDITRDDVDTAEARSRLADSISAVLRSGEQPDEGLINALTSDELDEQMGFPSRGLDREWTPEASAWLQSYNAGWIQAVSDRLDKLTAEVQP